MGSPRPPLAKVEDVRDELRRLGYLDHGVDRFVLGGRRTLRRPPRLAPRRRARRPRWAGSLFGVASTLAAAGIDPRLRAEPRDLLVLALYLTVILGVVIGAATLFAGLARGMAGARRPGSPARP